MPEEQAVDILRRFVSQLNADDGNISEAVNVADTFGSLDNPNHLKIFDNYLKAEFNLPENSKDTKVLYGLLLKLLYQKMESKPDSILAAELQQYPIPAVDQISIKSLSDTTGITQMHFFFDDEDGLTSFSTFLAAFKSAGYTVQEFEHYVVIKSKGKNTNTIYANKPLSEREGQAILIQMVQDDIIHPTVIVHRGHSYYAMNTISQIPNYAKVVFLGSCGGYHNISEVIKRAPQAQIIASKQIGTYVVNNTLLVEMSKQLKDQDQLIWANLWTSMDSKLKGSGKGYERFLDYVPPHKNLGAIFIQAYNRITQEDNGQ
jgi:phenolic acid decarboxylase